MRKIQRGLWHHGCWCRCYRLSLSNVSEFGSSVRFSTAVLHLLIYPVEGFYSRHPLHYLRNDDGSLTQINGLHPSPYSPLIKRKNCLRSISFLLSDRPPSRLHRAASQRAPTEPATPTRPPSINSPNFQRWETNQFCTNRFTTIFVEISIDCVIVRTPMTRFNSSTVS